GTTDGKIVEADRGQSLVTGVLRTNPERVATGGKAECGQVDRRARRSACKRGIACVAEAEHVHAGQAKRFRVAEREQLRHSGGGTAESPERISCKRIDE